MSSQRHNDSNPNISQILQKQNEYINELRSKLEERDEQIGGLLEKVLNLQVATDRNTKSQSKNLKAHQQAASAPPQTPKTKPNQLHMQQTPQGFKPTKDAFFAHIRIMWGLIFEKSVPVLPDPTLLKEFYNCFDYSDEIHQVVKSNTAVNLIPPTDIITLRGAKPGREKIGQAIVNFQEFFILYIQAMLSKLGIRQWAPALDEPIDTLYNEACRISAIQTFRQVAVGGAYQYTNINLRFLNNIGLLEGTYNHFVHYLKTKESGAYIKNLERGVISKIDNVNDEFVEKVGYVIKKLPYRSQKATIFMRRVDEGIEKSSINEGRRSQAHIHIESKTSKPTAFGRVPKGLPIDFFDPECQKYWEEATQDYDLSPEIAGEDDEDNDSSSDSEKFDSDSSLNSENSSSQGNDNEEEEADEDKMMDEDSHMQTSQELQAPKVGRSSDVSHENHWENW
ncbi:hypothetical protein O181_001448 [Austropuccinia psidii MF-1]|uniref:Uncharacterized protein n=1 Tax=Austropuccinia psidii MF-1 TaxID=1389203 RepID=A0A9Q3BAJ3_9BASI|nr:hypothetical protein [Austropuccinia psidii MF-1]